MALTCSPQSMLPKPPRVRGPVAVHRATHLLIRFKFFSAMPLLGHRSHPLSKASTYYNYIASVHVLSIGTRALAPAEALQPLQLYSLYILYILYALRYTSLL